MTRKNNREHFAHASRSLVGGVNSPVRAFKGVGGDPVFFVSGEGAYVTDVEGKQYIDYIGSWGPMILGHGNKVVKRALQAQIEQGIGFGASHPHETALAEKLKAVIPWIDKVRFVSTGTEACMTAVRLARAFTQRDTIVKMAGHYHGHSDAFLVAAGSGALTMGAPNSAGVCKATAAQTRVVEFHDIAALQAALSDGSVACVILEPVAGNMGCIPSNPAYLQQVKALCEATGTLCIFDEVMSGFRVARGGASERYNIEPDLVTYGKVIGGGMPVAAVAGKDDIMNLLSPEGAVYQAGTLSGNPVAMAAGLATFDLLDEPLYEQLATYAQQLADGLQALADKAGIAFSTTTAGAMLGCFFAKELPVNLTQVQASDTRSYNSFFHTMLENGVALPPSAFEAWFINACMDDKTLALTLQSAEKSFNKLAQS